MYLFLCEVLSLPVCKVLGTMLLIVSEAFQRMFLLLGLSVVLLKISLFLCQFNRVRFNIYMTLQGGGGGRGGQERRERRKEI